MDLNNGCEGNKHRAKRKSTQISLPHQFGGVSRCGHRGLFADLLYLYLPLSHSLCTFTPTLPLLLIYLPFSLSLGCESRTA